MSSIDLSSNKLIAAKYDLTVTSALYSSLLGLVKIHMMTIFPKDYFKYIFINNSVASVSEGGNNDDDLYNKPIPNLAINMKYAPQDASFSGDSYMLSNQVVFRNPSGMNSLYDKILYDRENKVYISAMSSRAKHSFEMNIRVNQELEAVNILGFLRNKMPLNRAFYVNKKLLEVPIPNSLIGVIAASKGYDLSNKQNIPIFNEMLLKHSEGRIVYKIHPASGKYLYFYKYMTNLLFRVTSYNDDIQANKTDKSQLNTDIKLTLDVEYNNHLYFLSESYNLGTPDVESFAMDTNEFSTVMHWTLQVPELYQLPSGKKLVSKLELVTDINSSLDSTPFDEYIHTKITRYMDYIKEQNPTDFNLVLDEEFEFKLLRDGVALKRDVDYNIDWSNYTLHIINPYLNYDYKLFIFGNISKIDSHMQSNMKNSDINNNILVQN